MNSREITVPRLKGEANSGLSAQDFMSAGYLERAVNVDIFDSLSVRSRQGNQKIYSSGSAVHSIWSGSNVILFREGTTLRSFNIQDNTSTILTTGLSNHPLPVRYREIGDAIYCMDGSFAGIYRGGGFGRWQIISGTEFDNYASRMLIAFGGTIFYTRPFNYTSSLDSIGIGEVITMIEAVRTGFWVGTVDNVYFYQGDSPPFRFVHVADIGVYPRTSQKLEGNTIDSKLTGLVVLWASPHGIFLGGEDGYLLNRTPYYKLPKATSGSSCIRRQSGLVQYIVYLDDSTPNNDAYTPIKSEVNAPLPSLIKL